MFKRGDIVRKNFPDLDLVNVVEQINSQSNTILINGKWEAATSYRLMGSYEFYKSRLAEQYRYLKTAEAKTYYSPDRREEVLTSIQVIILRFERIVWDAEEILLRSSDGLSGLGGRYLSDSSPYFAAVVCHSYRSTNPLLRLTRNLSSLAYKKLRLSSKEAEPKSFHV